MQNSTRTPAVACVRKAMLSTIELPPFVRTVTPVIVKLLEFELMPVGELGSENI
jgi:hypothetical protein